MKLSILILFFLGMTLHNEKKAKVFVTFTNLKNRNGKLMIQLLDTSEKVIQSAIINPTAPKCEWVSNEVPLGKYVVKAFHDENENGKLDTNFVGFPIEGWGTSNNVKARFGPPKFANMIFNCTKDTFLEIDLNY